MAYILLSDNKIQYQSTDLFLSNNPFSSNTDCIVMYNGQLRAGTYWQGYNSVSDITGYVFAIYISCDIVGSTTVSVTFDNRLVYNESISNSIMQRLKVKIPVNRYVSNSECIVTINDVNKYTQSKILISGFI